MIHAIRLRGRARRLRADELIRSCPPGTWFPPVRAGGSFPIGYHRGVIEPSQRHFEASERLADRFPVLALTGQLDYGTVAAIEQHLEHLIGRGHHAFVVDLTRATLLTSSVVNVLFAAVRRVRVAGGGMALACADRNVCKIIGLTSLDRVAPLSSTVEEALRTLANRLAQD